MSSNRRRPDGPATMLKGLKSGSSKKGSSGESPNPLSLHDYSSAFEAGVEAEEKGERFAVSFKAMRRYQEAADLYLRALQLAPGEADAAYNAARVHFLLATAFYPPPLSLEALSRSIDLYRKALLLAPPPSLVDSERGLMLEQAFSLDVRFNLGVALQSLGEMLDEVSSGVRAREVLVEAAETLSRTAEGQEMVLAYQRRMMQTGDLPVAAPGSSASAAQDQDMETAADESQDDDDDDEGAPSDFEASVVTPASTLESLTSLHATLLSLLSNTTSTSSSPSLDEVLSLASQARARGQSIVELYPDGNTSNDEERLEWSEAVHELRLAVLNSGVAEASKRAELASEAGGVWPALGSQEETMLRALEDDMVAQGTLELQGSTTAVQGAISTTANEAAVKRHIQLECDLADGLFALAKLRIRQLQASLRLGAASQVQVASLSSRAWDLSSRSSKLYLAALASLNGGGGEGSVGGSTGLSISTSSTSTPLTRAKSNINVSLTHLSLFRSSSPFILSTPRLNEKVLSTLRDNAVVYSKRSVQEIGLGWTVGEEGDDVDKVRSLVTSTTLPNGGWEALRSLSDALLAVARAAFKKGQQQQQQLNVDGPAQATAGALLKRLTGATRGLVGRRDAFETSLVGSTTYGESFRSGLDLKRFDVASAGSASTSGPGAADVAPLQRVLEEVDEGLGGVGFFGSPQEKSASGNPVAGSDALGEARREWEEELGFWRAWAHEISPLAVSQG